MPQACLQPSVTNFSFPDYLHESSGGRGIGGFAIVIEGQLERKRRFFRFWRSPFLLVPVAILVAGLFVWGLRFVVQPTVLRIAVGPAGSADVTLISDLAREIARSGGRSVRLKVVTTDDVKASAAALDEGRADLAVVRSDVAMSASGLTVAILHRNAVALIAPHSGTVRKITDLAKKRIGVLRPTPDNMHLLDGLLEEYGIDPGSVSEIGLEPDDVAAAIRDKRVDVVMAVAPASGALITNAVAAVAAASKGEPVFVAVKEAEAIAQRKPVYESQEIVSGLFSGNPTRPKENFNTLAITYRLVASRDLEDYVVSDFTRRLFTLRTALSLATSLADHIEKPDTDSDTALALHPGASAFFDGNEKSFFDRYDDWFYLGAMGLSGVVSGLAALIASARAWIRRSTLSAIDKLIHLQLGAREALDHAALDAAEAALARLSVEAQRHARDGRLDDSGLAALRLAMDECRQTILDRRSRLVAARSPYREIALAGPPSGLAARLPPP
jgi:TRAP transporter TAXI family solute receptor